MNVTHDNIMNILMSHVRLALIGQKVTMGEQLRRYFPSEYRTCWKMNLDWIKDAKYGSNITSLICYRIEKIVLKN